jgi:large subunit ribosomal protein L10e
MRQAWGKSYGKVCRVNIGDPLISVRIKAANVRIAMESFRKASMKFPGR